ncbi:hypothetical protein [Streptomyces griseoviridis]|uniref:hypothetical protein n=1 Tax=Streptomyces griseoviridis TaxID=45398 RepID=UPI003431202E
MDEVAGRRRAASLTGPGRGLDANVAVVLQNCGGGLQLCDREEFGAGHFGEQISTRDERYLGLNPKFTFLGDHDAVLFRETGTIEATIASLDGPWHRLRKIPGVRRVDAPQMSLPEEVEYSEESDVELKAGLTEIGIKDAWVLHQYLQLASQILRWRSDPHLLNSQSYLNIHTSGDSRGMTSSFQVEW